MKYILEYTPEFSEAKSWAFESDKSAIELRRELKNSLQNKQKFFNRSLKGDFLCYDVYTLEGYWESLSRL